MYKRQVTEAGYGASTGEKKAAERQNAPEGGSLVAQQLAAMKRRLILSIGFLIPLMYVSMGHMAGLPLPGFLAGYENSVGYAMTQFLLALPVVYEMCIRDSMNTAAHAPTIFSRSCATGLRVRRSNPGRSMIFPLPKICFRANSASSASMTAASGPIPSGRLSACCGRGEFFAARATHPGMNGARTSG